MKNTFEFSHFLNTLKASNRGLGFFVDWEKCLENVNKIRICLNHLNFLLGKDKDSIKAHIALLFDEYPKAFGVLHLLLAVRDGSSMVLDSSGAQCRLDSYLKNADSVFDFLCESGLIDIFTRRDIKDLNDFVFGIEVELDSNARKNRGGSTMESHLSQIFRDNQLNFKEQVNIKDFPRLHEAFGDDIKKFDFVIFGAKKIYFLECNFYTSGGSKLNETARAYQELGTKFERFADYEFIWITDGQGWLESKNKLAEAYKSVEIYNLSNLNDFVAKVKNER